MSMANDLLYGAGFVVVGLLLLALVMHLGAYLITEFYRLGDAFKDNRTARAEAEEAKQKAKKQAEVANGVLVRNRPN